MSFIASFNISYDDECNLDSLHLYTHIMSFLNIHSHIMYVVIQNGLMKTIISRNCRKY